MKKLNELFQELGISKVRLAKYLGVSRQMVYNYLELDDISKWPKEKRILLCKLLDIEDGGADAIDKIKVTTDYLMNVEAKLNQGVKNSLSNETYIDMKGLNKESQQLIADISYLTYRFYNLCYNNYLSLFFAPCISIFTFLNNSHY